MNRYHKKSFCNNYQAFLSSTYFKWSLVLLSLGLVLLFYQRGCFAAGTDYLAGTVDAAKTTLAGSGKKFMYIAEGTACIISFIMTRKPTVFIGIVVIAFFINSILLGKFLA